MEWKQGINCSITVTLWNNLQYLMNGVFLCCFFEPDLVKEHNHIENRPVCYNWEQASWPRLGTGQLAKIGNRPVGQDWEQASLPWMGTGQFAKIGNRAVGQDWEQASLPWMGTGQFAKCLILPTFCACQFAKSVILPCVCVFLCMNICVYCVCVCVCLFASYLFTVICKIFP